MTTSKGTEHTDAPIQDFSHCHAGILAKLDMLGELPALLEPAARARDIAERAVEFFREAIFEHHLDEERELFPAVLASAAKGEEHDRVQVMVRQLTDEHRNLEATWKRLEPGLKKVAKELGITFHVGSQTVTPDAYANALQEVGRLIGEAGVVVDRIDVGDLVPYIDWTPFFHAWGLRSRYPGILEHAEYGEAARPLWDDAQRMLARIVDEQWFRPKSVVGFWPAHRDGDDIVLPEHGHRLHGLRQGDRPAAPSSE